MQQRREVLQARTAFRMTAKVIKLEQGKCKKKAKTKVTANARRTNEDLDGCKCARRDSVFAARLGYYAIFSEEETREFCANCEFQ
jgi:hypothetical protein